MSRKYKIAQKIRYYDVKNKLPALSTAAPPGKQENIIAVVSSIGA